jgi:peptide/nickel transport system ATP-binding protein
MAEKTESINEVLLRVRDLKTYFRTGAGVARAVDGVSFDIRRGETYALVGESGCGKSVTALSIIQLIQKPAGFIAGGSVEYRGQDILRLPEMEKRKYRGKEIAMIFQEPMSSLNPVMTVGAQIIEAIVRHQPQRQEQARQQAIEMLERVQIPEPEQRFGEYPHQLSGGMRQRVMIAIALSCKPGLLIADEPTTALDVTIQEQILGLIRDIQQEFGTAVLMITHDLGVVAENAHRVGVMYAGKIVEEADRERLFRRPSHPYTAKLLESLPRLDQRDRALETIAGRVPAATHFPDHCRFADRCHMAMDSCRQREPSVFATEDGHQVACHLYDEALMERRVDPLEVRSKAQDTVRTTGEGDGEALIEVRNLKVWFPIRRGVLRRTVGHVKAVDGVDLRIPRGRTLALVGESGCGKTTLGRGLIQLVHPTAGSVNYQGEELIGLSRTTLKPYRRRLQMVFQDPYSSLNPRLMVGEIITEGMEAHGLGANRCERLDRAKHLLEQVGLEAAMVERYPHEFSGGQRQRLGIARCLAVEPEFIICDEATSALDVSVQAQIINLLEDLQDRLGLTYLLITHDLSVVSHMADEVAVMYLGRIVEQGQRDEIFTDPKHPYTRALLAAIPQVDADSGRHKIHLGGDVPSPVNPPLGCHFHPRCPDRFERCPSAYPEATQFSATHNGRCFLYDEATGADD